MQISFYVLNDRFESSTSAHEALLDFVCKLTQTVLKKSELSLVIIDDDTERLALLDERLWTFETTSFIPHILLKPTIKSLTTLDGDLNKVATGFDKQDLVISETHHSKSLVDLVAPVVLTTDLPAGFDGVVLNLASSPLLFPSDADDDASNATPVSNTATVAYALPDRVLEIIAPDTTSKQQGRKKYKYYQSQGFTLKHFPID